MREQNAQPINVKLFQTLIANKPEFLLASCVVL